MKKTSCDKCKAQTDLTYWHEFGETYGFCALCDAILKRQDKTGIIKYQFMQDDHGATEMNNVEKNMICARQNRSKGLSLWQ